MLFKACLGLRINLENSGLIPMGMMESIDALALKLGYKVGNLLSHYLGLSLGAIFKFVLIRDGVKEIFQKRLTKWKR